MLTDDVMQASAVLPGGVRDTLTGDVSDVNVLLKVDVANVLTDECIMKDVGI